MIPITLTAPHWMRDAVCSDVEPEVFFPRKEYDEDVAEAKAICRPCGARASCLEWALVNDEHGIWGGTTREERQRMKRKQVTA